MKKGKLFSQIGENIENSENNLKYRNFINDFIKMFNQEEPQGSSFFKRNRYFYEYNEQLEILTIYQVTKATIHAVIKRSGVVVYPSATALYNKLLSAMPKYNGFIKNNWNFNTEKYKD